MLEGKVCNLAEVLHRRLVSSPHRLAFSFATEAGAYREVSYEELVCRVLAIARSIEPLAGKKDRVLLLLQPGIDYIAAFLACLTNGMVAVPSYPPRRNRRSERTIGIIRSAMPAAAILDRQDEQFLELSHALSAPLPAVALCGIKTDGVSVRELEDHLREHAVQADDLAFLQYTSGSTGSPKGVMVSHANLAHNCAQMEKKFRLSGRSCMVSWLPPYHDMGLILGLLEPLFTGFPCHIISPATFLQRPIRWLELMTRTRATISGAPNFAYELCIKRIPVDALGGLDLSSWDVAFNGAEPVHPDTLRRFTRLFAPYGFRPRAIYPCYGLAENTLMATGQDSHREVEHPPYTYISARNPERPASSSNAELVDCGSSINGQELLIVDPQTCNRLPDGEEGEIWISGPSVARGYWNDAQETERTFGATLNDSGAFAVARRYLRTGDLGYVRNKKLFVTGRIKDILIIRGMKYYPQDIERIVEENHVEVRKGGYCAAFALESDTDGIGIGFEIERVFRKSDREALRRAIRATVANEFGLKATTVAMFEPGQFPKTSSGKTPRAFIRSLALHHETDAPAYMD